MIVLTVDDAKRAQAADKAALYAWLERHVPDLFDRGIVEIACSPPSPLVRFTVIVCPTTVDASGEIATEHVLRCLDEPAVLGDGG